MFLATESVGAFLKQRKVFKTFFLFLLHFPPTPMILNFFEEGGGAGRGEGRGREGQEVRCSWSCCPHEHKVYDEAHAGA